MPALWTKLSAQGWLGAAPVLESEVPRNQFLQRELRKGAKPWEKAQMRARCRLTAPKAGGRRRTTLLPKPGRRSLAARGSQKPRSRKPPRKKKKGKGRDQQPLAAGSQAAEAPQATQLDFVQPGRERPALCRDGRAVHVHVHA